MIKKIAITTSLIFLVLILTTIENNKSQSTFVAAQNNQTFETAAPTPTIKNKQTNKNTKRTLIPLIKPDTNSSINYYPNNKIPTKTANTLLTVAAGTIALGVSLLGFDDVFDKAKFQTNRVSLSKFFFRFINRIL
jgi:hypothetical protein